MDLDPTTSALDDQPWSITNSLKMSGTASSAMPNAAGPTTTTNTNANIGVVKTRHKSQETKDAQSPTPQIIHDSTLSIYERVRHFLYINFVLNKKSFILSILSYVADLVLFVALNLYLFSNKKFINEMICLPVYEELIPVNSRMLNATTTYMNESSVLNPPVLNRTRRELILNKVSSDSMLSLSSLLSVNSNFTSQLQLNQAPSKSLKQSYLTLQIIIIFVFFICFILSYLIKLQFKYHRLALNLYDYDIEIGGEYNLWILVWNCYLRLPKWRKRNHFVLGFRYLHNFALCFGLIVSKSNSGLKISIFLIRYRTKICQSFSLRYY